MGVGVAVAAVALGASVIEKHFTLARSDGGVDSAFSLEPHELEALVVESERAWQALGNVTYGPTEAENKSLLFRRSLYVSENISKGRQFSAHNIRVVRPAGGLPPCFYKQVLGQTAKRDYKFGEPLLFSDIMI